MTEELNETTEKVDVKVLAADTATALVGVVVGFCVGGVVERGLSMITPPSLRAAEKVAFTVGKFVISSMITSASSVYAVNEINELRSTYSEAKTAALLGFNATKQLEAGETDLQLEAV